MLLVAKVPSLTRIEASEGCPLSHAAMPLQNRPRINHVLLVLWILYLVLITAVQELLGLLFLFALVTPEGTRSSLSLEILCVSCCHGSSHPHHTALYR